LFDSAVRNGVIVAVVFLAVIMFGVVSMFEIPVQMVPDIDPRIISVQTRWPGATPQDVEKEIVVEQEEYLRNIPGLTRMVATVRTGSADIELEFPHGLDTNELLIRVNNALAQVPDYPENVDEPEISTTSVSDSPFIFYRLKPLAGADVSIEPNAQLDFLEDNILARLERLPGVADTTTYGGSERQVQILVDPKALAARNISMGELRAAIRARNRDVSGGDLDSGKRRYLLRTVGRFTSIEDIESLIIKRDGDSLVRLSDVGHARMGTFEPRSISFGNGRPALTFGVQRQIGSNAIDVQKRVVAELERLNASVLKDVGLEVIPVTDDVRYVIAAIGVVTKNLAIGALLATIVLFVFLRSVPATLLGAVAIPVCAIACFLGLSITGRTINVISLAGIAFALGMTLDNNIVVLENIYRHLGMGKSRRQAAVDGVREVWSAVLASTLTTVCVFAPIVFIEEEAGQLYSDIAIAIAVAILMSMAFAIVAVPTAAARVLNAPRAPGDTARAGHRGASATFRRFVLGSLDWLMTSRTRRLVYSVLVIGLALSIIRFLTPPAEYLPEGEEPKVFAQQFAPPGYNIDTMLGLIDELHETVMPHVGVDPGPFERGETPFPPLRVVTSYSSAAANFMVVEVIDPAHTTAIVEALTEEFQTYPGVLAFVSRGSIFAGNQGGSRSINVDITGTDLEALFDVGFKAFVRAKEIFDNPQVRPQPSTVTLGQPLIEIRPDWARAAEIGISADELGYAIWAFSDGAFVDEFFLGDDKIDMFVYSEGGAIAYPEDLEQLELYAPGVGIFPLSAVAQIVQTVNTETIRRVDAERAITLSIIPPRSVALETGVERVREALIGHLERTGQTGSVRLAISGASDQLEATRQALSGNFFIAIATAYLLLVAIFRHFGFPLLIMTTVPIGIGGGIFGLVALNFIGARLPAFGLQAVQQPFDMITMLGFLVLIGTVVNNPILIVERTLANLKAGGSIRDAVMDAVETRLRPIMMSTITTVFGLSPLVLLPGAGTELYRGLGAIVMFGLIFSTLVTLTLVPSLLSLVLEARGAGGPARSPEPPEHGASIER